VQIKVHDPYVRYDNAAFTSETNNNGSSEAHGIRFVIPGLQHPSDFVARVMALKEDCPNREAYYAGHDTATRDRPSDDDEPNHSLVDDHEGIV